MAGRSSAERMSLERQNAAIMAVFERAGFDQIAPDIIQPADIFLERSGEDIRARTFVFNDPEGHELCLRPDLTVPACRYHLSHAEHETGARYCYLGPAFRFPDERLSPQEFTQAGLEWFGGENPITEEARILKLATSALEAAGASSLNVTIGDLGLFDALLSDMAMPERWRRRLRHQFWRPQAFHALLEKFSSSAQSNRTSISETVDAVANRDANVVVEEILSAQNLALVGGRTSQDVANRLTEKMADRSEPPLSTTMKEIIEAYLKIETPLTEVPALLYALGNLPNFGQAIRNFETRIAALETQGLNPKRFQFSADFGRELEYYTGFVFQIEMPVGNEIVAVAGGGRYDNLLADLGARKSIPAVGCAIHTERLSAVLQS